MNEDKELQWDDIIQNDNSFVELPEGDYDFTIEKFERSRFNGSAKLPACNMAVVYFIVKSPDGQETTIRENFIMHTRLEWKLSELFRSVGLKKENAPIRMNWNALPGLSGRAHVTLDPDKNDPSKKYNHIVRLYPKGGGAQTWKAGNF